MIEYPKREGLELQRKLIAKRDWDWMIVLDAMRWDYWWEYMECGNPVLSSAGDTKAWTIRMGKFFKDVFAINSNPYVSLRMSKYLKKDVKVWDFGWREVNGIPTVPPKEVVKEALKYKDSDEKLLIWFVQPHGPYPMHTPPLPAYRNKRISKQFGIFKELQYKTDMKIINFPEELMKDKEELSKILHSGYRSNMEWVLKELQVLLRNRGSKKVVVTADHGECLGEEGLFGHNDKWNSDYLKIVPWSEWK